MTVKGSGDDEREAKVWRNHPGLGGQDGIGVRRSDGGGHQWYTVDRAEQVVAGLTAGLIALGKHPEPEMEFEVTYALPVEAGSKRRPYRGSSGMLDTEGEAIEFAALCEFDDVVIMGRAKGVPAGEWAYMPAGEDR